MNKEEGNRAVWILQMVGELTKLTKKQQLVWCREMLAQDGPEQFLEYTEVLNAACHANLIKESVALPLFNRMSDVYLSLIHI